MVYEGDNCDEQLNNYIRGVLIQSLHEYGAVYPNNLIAGDIEGSNYLISDGDGNTYWMGDNTGLPFASTYSNSDIDVSLTTQNVWYPIDSSPSGQVGEYGEYNNCLIIPPAIEIIIAGRYEIKWSMSVSFPATPGSSQQIFYGIMIDSGDGIYTIQGDGRAERTLANSTDTGNSGGVGILNLDVGDRVILGMRNGTSAGKVMTVNHYNLTISQKGG